MDMSFDHHSLHDNSTNYQSAVGTLAHTVTSTLAEGIVHTISHWKVIALGQSVALILAVAGATNETLALECGVSAPSTYNAFGYSLTCLLGLILLKKEERDEKNQKKMVENDDANGDDGTSEEREVFHTPAGKMDPVQNENDAHNNHDNGGDNNDDHNEEDEEEDDDDDELTLESKSPTKRQSIFSLRLLTRRGRNDSYDDDDHPSQLRTPRRRPFGVKTHGIHAASSSRGGSHADSGSSKQRSTSNRHHHHNRPSHPFLFGLLTIHAKWHYYLAVAVVEAQAYYLIFLAFRYTSFTFVYVSDALAIPATMAFTKMFMKRRYSWSHLIGGAVCIMGIVVNTAGDMKHDDANENVEDGGGGLGGEHTVDYEHIKGDLFAILGAILLGLDDVWSEIIVSDYGGVTEMLFMKGLFGALISILQIALLERDEAHRLFSQTYNDDGSTPSSECTFDWRMTLFAIHVITRALDVCGEMQFLYVSEAALLNLLLLTSDLYAAIFDVLTIGLVLTPLFYFAFVLILVGLVIYEAGPSPAEQPTSMPTPAAIEFRPPRPKKTKSGDTGGTGTGGVGSGLNHRNDMAASVTSSMITDVAGNVGGGLDLRLSSDSAATTNHGELELT